jgi:multicomponent Na+:H+ antiporter subunit C
MLVATGVYLLFQRGLFRAILGLSLLAHAGNLLVLSAGGEGQTAPILGRANGGLEMADPLPQAMVLTAIVISMALTLYLVGLLRANARNLQAVTVESPPASDEGRDAAVVARELGAEEGSR